jgi:hypothetical protein
MRFTIATLTTGALALLSTPFALALEAPEIVVSINTLSTKLLKLQPIAQSINSYNGPLIILNQGPYPVLLKNVFL